MIHSFVCRETERLFADEVSRRLLQQIQRVAWRLDDLRVPYGNRLDALKDGPGEPAQRPHQ